MSRGNNSVRMGVDLSSVNSMLDALGDDVEAAVRPASQAAAQVFYDEIKGNVASIKQVTGNLSRSIYQKFSPENSRPGRAEYHVSWNAKTAPHAGLVEYGHLQRYKYYKGSDGKIRPMVRPGMDGRMKPGRHAAQSEKDAYYVTLPTPIQVPAKAFVRRALDKTAAAINAAEEELLMQIEKRGAQ